MIYNFPFRVLAERSVEPHMAGFLQSLRPGRKCVIITDGLVRKIIADRIAGSMSGFAAEVLCFDSLEKKTSIDFP